MITHIIITLAAVFITTYLAHRYSLIRDNRNWQRTLEIIKIQETVNASDKFYSAILRALEGIYSDTNTWGKNINGRLKKSIPPIELAVTEFKRFVTCKTNIEVALKDYKDCCYETTYDEITKYIMHSKDKGGFDPREIFITKVDALLEFAKKP